MKVQIQEITPKTLFNIVFAVYLLLGMHFNVDHLGGYGLYLPFNTVGWMFISLLIGLGCWQIGNSGKIIFSQFHMFCWIGIGLMCLPLLYPNNENSGLVLHRFLGLGAGLLLYLAFQQFCFNREDRYLLLYIILGGILIQTLYGLGQHFLPIESWTGIIVERPYGVLMQKNVMATFLVTGAAISLFLLIKDEKVIKSQIKRGIVYGIPFLTSILYLPLQSRTGYLTFFISMGLISILGYEKKKQLATWFGLAIIGFLIGAKTPYKLRTEQNLEIAANIRKVTYQLTFELWKANPILGIGYGNYFSSFRHYYAQRKSEDSSIFAATGNMDHPHNETLFWMAEGGISPLIGLLIIAGGFLVMLWRTKRKEAIGMAGMIMPILVHTQLELPFYLSLIHWFLFIFMLVCVDEEFGEKRVQKISLKIFPRVVAILVPGLIIPVMITVLQTGSAITKYERTGFKNPDLLLSAWNPGALRKKYDVHAMTLHLNIAKKTKDHEKLQHYIVWAESYVKHSPYPFIYYDLAKSYEAIGDKEKAWEVYDQARYLFPDTKWLESSPNDSLNYPISE
jgi:O-antigen polymerase